MQIDYLKDLPSDLGKRMRSRKHWLHWLHPSLGPLPDLIGTLCCMEARFIGAVWLTPRAVLTAIELVQDDEAATPSIGSPILRTYCWRPENNKLVCHKEEITVPELKDEDDEWEWKRQTMISVLKGSIRLNISTRVGGHSRGNQMPFLGPADQLGRSARRTGRTRQRSAPRTPRRP